VANCIPPTTVVLATVSKNSAPCISQRPAEGLGGKGRTTP
jgi:hypothetical protein